MGCAGEQLHTRLPAAFNGGFVTFALIGMWRDAPSRQWGPDLERKGYTSKKRRSDIDDVAQGIRVGADLVGLGPATATPSTSSSQRPLTSPTAASTETATSAAQQHTSSKSFRERLGSLRRWRGRAFECCLTWRFTKGGSLTCCGRKFKSSSWT